MTSKSYKEWADEFSDFSKVYAYWETYLPKSRQNFADEQAFTDFIGNLCRRAEHLSVVTGEWASTVYPPADELYLESIGELDDDEEDDRISRKDFKTKWGYRQHLEYCKFDDGYKFYFSTASKPCDIRALLEEGNLEGYIALDIENETYTPAYTLDIGRTAERYQVATHLETIGYYEAKRNPNTDDLWFRNTFKEEINWEIENGDFLMAEIFGLAQSMDFVGGKTPLSPNNVYQHATYEDAKKTYRAIGCYYFDRFYDVDNVQQQGWYTLKARLDLAKLLDIIVYLYPDYQTVDDLINTTSNKKDKIKQFLADDGLVVKYLKEKGIELHPMLKARVLRGYFDLEEGKYYTGEPPKKSGDSVFPSAIVAKNRAIKAQPYPPVVGQMLKDDSLPLALRESPADDDTYAETLLAYNEEATQFYLAISDPRYGYEYITKPMLERKELLQQLDDEIKSGVAQIDPDVYKERCKTRLTVNGVDVYHHLTYNYDVSCHLDLAIKGGLGLGDERFGTEMFKRYVCNLVAMHENEVDYHYYQKAKKAWQDDHKDL